MQLHQLKPIHKPRKKRIVGRGGKKGTYSGRGTKGQKARESLNLKPLIRDLIKRYPKLRGHRQRSKIRIQKSVVLNLDVLEKNFKDEEKITPKTLLEKRIISKIKGDIPKVKILGDGEIKKPLIFEGCGVSKSAKEKIEKAGGKISL
ncbi:MAG: 50S ribosomal protein L15 [Candidatus Nealsonbacteria bacterium RBG_13_42_11]|uniref:Large ribosomal subunit protein uL15 n=1 Tax=Candidatus Nealsonbacteria bacterium RBG_13_42_11 TaxID=1801663 RepID=A0A1G2DZ22_9BACT|nr:MAG: 50S ribosomal protein L15 [Candidatus Nealsonbacteria bacterium RBG_13_42_11]